MAEAPAPKSLKATWGSRGFGLRVQDLGFSLGSPPIKIYRGTTLGLTLLQYGTCIYQRVFTIMGVGS